jgi:glycerol-3-phosphate cytidylyltransferase
MKKKMLFLDDRTERILAAQKQFSSEYDVTPVANVKECLRYLSNHDWDEVWLDADLDGDDFALSGNVGGLDVVFYIRANRWPEGKRKPLFIVHSRNAFLASKMVKLLQKADVFAVWKPFCYDKYINPKVGLVAGAFDLIHPGYVELLQDARSVCDYLIVALHEDPSVENPKKVSPILSVTEREKILLSLRYVDRVVIYHSERELTLLLKTLKPDIRVNGNDHGGISTRPDLGIPVYYHERKTGWSATKLKTMIYESMKEKE